MSLKERISSPLEAGTSLLNAHHLPPHLTPALEQASGRLAKKAMHITLVVARRDYQLPPTIPPLGSPGLAVPPPPSSPRFSSPVAALKHIVRSRSFSKPLRLNIDTTSAPLASPSTPFSGLSFGRPRWATTPLTPKTPMSPPPMTPCTASSITTDGTAPIMSSSGTMWFIQPAGLPLREEKELRIAFDKASHRHELNLPSPMNSSMCGLNAQLIHQSIIQNDVMFKSEGLTLVALDGLYSLKAALSAYARTGSLMRLEDAVDELRRLVIANNGRKVTKVELLRSYDWLRISDWALRDLDEMYKRAYGGLDAVGAISGMPKIESEPFAEPIIRSEFDHDSDDGTEIDDELNEPMVEIEMTRDASRRATPKTPVLKLQTNFDPLPAKLRSPGEDGQGDQDNDSARTAKATDQPAHMVQFWPTSSIDEIMTAGVLSPERSSMRLGSMTPNGYDDISPTTRGEWGFLMVDDAFQGAKQAAIETW
ncbi:uncharacterized protein J7T54_000791 [Emericellopsis cladophorae]|uniref:DUF7582 domain-containing protein n=1 Tax=Emericellopsis cladophorae TaxID=2686198 RepID=A0A9Q0BAK1_9HYPO|nr:uncharacterized protein J7T54_000791 [Emericellopsis cladophorae]KAI6778402.1 hypothetical protein J7T54_000791 [Emericellopsis cladophorae]